MNHNNPTKTVMVRRLDPHDHPEIRDHFLRLDVSARNARFCGAVNDRGVTEYARGIFRQNSIVCGAFVDGHLRGVAELRGNPRIRSSMAEAAFSVEPYWQDIGIGHVLIEHTLTVAQNRLVKSVRLVCQRANIRMWHLAQKHDAMLAFNQDMVDATIFPNWPTPISLAAELISEFQRIALFWRGRPATNRLSEQQGIPA